MELMINNVVETMYILSMVGFLESFLRKNGKTKIITRYEYINFWRESSSLIYHECLISCWNFVFFNFRLYTVYVKMKNRRLIIEDGKSSQK